MITPAAKHYMHLLTKVSVRTPRHRARDLPAMSGIRWAAVELHM
jgi:hypothetical protein